MIKMKKTTAGIALAATASLIAGPALMGGQAWADGTGEITIGTSAGNTAEMGITYKAIQIFSGDVKDGTDGKTISSPKWNTAVESAVVGVLEEYGYDATDKTAQDAIEFINANFGTTNDETVLDADTLGMKLAAALKNASGEPMAPGTQATLNAGYWLIIDNTAGAAGKMGTSPIFALVGGATAVNPTAKTSGGTPTLEKDVKEGDDWTDVADKALGESFEYKLEGTVSGNFNSFSAYKYNFIDALDEGIELDATVSETGVVSEGVQVLLGGEGGTDITGAFEITYKSSELKVVAKSGETVKIDGKDEDTGLVNNAKAAGVKGGDTITVLYKAKITGTDQIALAEAGINNKAYVEYSHAPNSTELSQTTTDKATVYSYALKLTKLDKATTTELAGAVFTVQKKGGNYIGLVDGKPVEQTDSYSFITDADGLITLDGLDSGTYVITETKAPEVDGRKYVPLAEPIEVTINANDRTAPTKAITSNPDENLVSMDGTNNVKVLNNANIGLPLTGEMGITLALVAGGIIVLVGVVGIVRNRRKNDQIED